MVHFHASMFHLSLTNRFPIPIYVDVEEPRFTSYQYQLLFPGLSMGNSILCRYIYKKTTTTTQTFRFRYIDTYKHNTHVTYGRVRTFTYGQPTIYRGSAPNSSRERWSRESILGQGKDEVTHTAWEGEGGGVVLGGGEEHGIARLQ